MSGIRKKGGGEKGRGGAGRLDGGGSFQHRAHPPLWLVIFSCCQPTPALQMTISVVAGDISPVGVMPRPSRSMRNLPSG